MKNLTKAAAIGAAAAGIGLGQARAEPTGSAGLAELMKGMGVEFAALLPGAAVDEHPIWSPDGAWIAANLGDGWAKLRLDSIQLDLAGWHVGDIGILAAAPVQDRASDEEVSVWMADTPSADRKLTTSAGLTVTMTDMGAFRVQQQGQGVRTMFQTGGENCHSLSLSPDERLMAFICELNGLFVYRLPV